ncbi:uncharacterized protein MYCGRDRAFT_86396 [Zymoseptoria tritici IPO323]|uniref:Uncharacterized protein n=1 Tax=Zymoseptoria tritici (strain CBS 115943 / IPO323) TaxID=336722 RepID=F9XCS9_ZYMTI|nr:uncharacterized protein MYCGRDRAFT_86396 [Zymoseptoria tritici IPO323]EGP86361.1 hypothetical protein MYCGRDRAFT_86396 [Zymoseptoria tritici IPO323]
MYRKTLIEHCAAAFEPDVTELVGDSLVIRRESGAGAVTSSVGGPPPGKAALLLILYTVGYTQCIAQIPVASAVMSAFLALDMDSGSARSPEQRRESSASDDAQARYIADTIGTHPRPSSGARPATPIGQRTARSSTSDAAA